jgi:hypothetical protein
MNTPKFDQLINKLLSEKEITKSFQPSLNVNYTFKELESVPAGTLSDDERRVYEVVDANSSYSGKDLMDYLKDEIKLDPREDLNDSKIKSVLNKLLDKGLLSAAKQSSEEDEVGALDVPEDEMGGRDRFSTSDVEDLVSPSFKRKGFGGGEF